MSSKVQTTPALQSVLQRIGETPEFKRLVIEIQRGARVVSVSGLVTGSARALALASLQQATGKLFAIVAQATHALEPLENRNETGEPVPFGKGADLVLGETRAGAADRGSVDTRRPRGDVVLGGPQDSALAGELGVRE